MMGKRLFLVTLAALVAATSARSSVTSTSFLPRSHVVDSDKQLLSLQKRVRQSRRPSPKHETSVTLEKARGGAISGQNQQILSAIAFLALNEFFAKAFAANDIKFPAMLGGCIILFVALLLAELVRPGLGDYFFDLLTPGTALLAKWLPVFFVPGLAMLPRAPSVGTALDVVKILGVVVLGFIFSLFTTGFSVLALRSAQGAVESAAPTQVTKDAAAPAPSKPYSQETLDFLVKGSILSFAVSVAATRTDNEYAVPLKTIFFGFSTVASYVWGARLPSDFTKIVHPLVSCTALTLAFVKLYGLATDTSFLDVLATYKAGSLHWSKTGAGDILLYLLGPAVISFAMSMYSRKKLLKENLPVVLLAMLVSSIGGLFGTAAFVRLINLGGSGGKMVRLSVLPRNVTTALAIAITNILGGDISIAASVVVLTGIIAATYGRTLLDKAGIQDPISRGLAVGASGQGLGVSSLLPEPDAFPFAAMAMVLTAVCSTSLVSIPAVKDFIIELATAGAKATAGESVTS